MRTKPTMTEKKNRNMQGYKQVAIVTAHTVYPVVQLGLGRNSCINREPSEPLVYSVIQIGFSQNNGPCVL